ncbi:hypothetical protein N0V90_004111 [Kalmusia sp. IMI 367209]|nr:hypothetical protein N0V90_004111 [Kalmusia sp. IMI 367209]
MSGTDVSSGGNGTTTDITPSSGGGLSTGAKAGIGVGVVLGVLVIALVFFLLYRRSKKASPPKVGEPQEPYHPSDEKQVAIPIASEISQKPELHGEPVVAGADMHQVVDHNTNSSYQYSTPDQWQHSQEYHSPPSELYNSNGHPSELHGAVYVNPAELHSTSRSQEMDGNTAPNANVSIQAQPPPPQTTAPPVLPPQLPALTTRPVQPLSAEEIEALEEEERRIDAEMEEAQRMKELREQKFAIQQKLRDAKRR